MYINVDAKQVASNACASKNKRLVETIDRLYHRGAPCRQQVILSRPSTVLHNIMNRRVMGVTNDAIDVRDSLLLVHEELHSRFDTLRNLADILLVAGRLNLPSRTF